MIAEHTQTSPRSSTDRAESTGKVRRRGKFKLFAVVAAVIILAWIGFDVYGPRSSSLRNFDPNEVARLETAMWRSYYDKREVLLFRQLAELMRTQYNLPLIRSNTVAYQAARAAFVFKDGRNRSDYEKALPNLENFYAAIRKVSDIPFDVDRAARLELEWWIVHRDRRSHAAGDLDRALADLQAELYKVPVERLAEHARLRAEAMTIRDNKAEEGGVTEADWARIDKLLHGSWQSLWRAVNER